VSEKEQVALRSTVEQIVKTYAEAEAAIVAGCQAIAGAVDTMNDRLGQTGLWNGAHFGRANGSRFDFSDPSDQIVDLRRQMWRAIVDRLEVRRMMSIKKCKELDEWLGKVDDGITIENVFGLFKTYERDLPGMLAEAIEEVYNWLRPYNSEHKTNSEYEVGERIVLTSCLDTWWIRHNGAPQVSHWRADHFRALDNVFSALDGKGQISKSYQGELGDAISKAKDGKGQTTYFEFRWFKNGNVHLKNRRMDLVEKFNRIAGGRRLKHDNAARKQPGKDAAA
jgi:hypothetical protein